MGGLDSCAVELSRPDEPVVSADRYGAVTEAATQPVRDHAGVVSLAADGSGMAGERAVGAGS